MKKIMISLLMLAGLNAAAQDKGFPEAKLGWKIGVQTYTFKEFDFYRSLAKIDSTGARFVECYPNMLIGGGIEGRMDLNMTSDVKKKVKSWLAERNLKLNNYGVVKMTTEEDWRRLFEFGKEMGIETFVGEPQQKFIPLISLLCDEYKINMALHNHANPSIYWSPDTVLAAVKGFSKRLGACADIGHWVRSGLDPVESLKKLNGRVLGVHMKDLNERGVKSAHDLIWGQGVSNISGVVAGLKRQKYKGMITAEYEYNWFNSVPDVKKSIAYLRSLL